MVLSRSFELHVCLYFVIPLPRYHCLAQQKKRVASQPARPLRGRIRRHCACSRDGVPRRSNFLTDRFPAGVRIRIRIKRAVQNDHRKHFELCSTAFTARRDLRNSELGTHKQTDPVQVVRDPVYYPQHFRCSSRERTPQRYSVSVAAGALQRALQPVRMRAPRSDRPHLLAWP